MWSDLPKVKAYAQKIFALPSIKNAVISGDKPSTGAEKEEAQKQAKAASEAAA